MAWERQGLKLSHGISSDGKKEDGFCVQCKLGWCMALHRAPQAGLHCGEHYVVTLHLRAE